MWLTVAKIALLGFLVGGVTVFLVGYIRGARRVQGQRDEPDLNMGPSTTWGVVAPTPLPDWAYWDDNDSTTRGASHEPPGQA